MHKKARLSLLLLLIIPAGLYAIYQISSLSEDEENINLIYQNQLDAILFSINQYSDNVVNEWVGSLEAAMIQKESVDSALIPLLQVNPGIKLIYTADTIPGGTMKIYPESLQDSPLITTVRDTLNAQMDYVANLLNYARANYRKISSARLVNSAEEQSLMLFFILKNPSPQGHTLAGIVIDPGLFIEMNLGPRLQTIAQEKFVISAFHQSVDEPVYTTTDSLSTDENAIAITKDFWILPDYYLGIGSEGESIFEIVRSRTLLNVGLLVFMLVVLGVGLFLIYRNVRKELQLAQNKSEFVSNVSHELRTPLALISMFAETLEMGRVTSQEKRQEYYQIIHKETSRLTGIVNKILTFSQMDANKKEFHFTPLDLNEVVKDVLDTYSFHFQQKGFTSSFHSEEELGVRADRESLQEVLINLLDNALKYSGDSRQVDISSGKKEYYAFVTIRDHGIGISKENQKQIFDKFFRVSTGDLAKSKGTGLGLSLVKHIIDHHGGKVTVESDLGKGSTFTIFIPLINSENG